MHTGISGVLIRRVFRLIVAAAASVVLLWAVLILAWRFLPPVSVLMLARHATFEPVDRRWVPLSAVSPRLIAAVVASEDAKFCRHGGVDWDALFDVLDEAGEDGPSRGASTLTMQTVKNLFLWPSRSVVRKGFEIPLALALDLLWTKERILEVYLNVAEWGPGIFGIEAAARVRFNKSAASLSAREAALLAAALPDPKRRDPAHPGPGLARLAGSVMSRAAGMEPWLDCLPKRSAPERS